MEEKEEGEEPKQKKKEKEHGCNCWNWWRWCKEQTTQHEQKGGEKRRMRKGKRDGREVGTWWRMRKWLLFLFVIMLRVGGATAASDDVQKRGEREEFSRDKGMVRNSCAEREKKESFRNKEEEELK